MDRTQVIDRLRKLLSRTTANGATEAEAQTALAMAQRLMDEHRLDAAEVGGDGGAGPGVVGVDAHESRRSETHYLYAMELVGEAFGVVCLQVTKRSRESNRALGCSYRIFGAAVDVEAASWGLNFLAATFKNLWNRYRVARKAPAEDRDGYFVGLTHGFRYRLHAERARLELDRPGSGTELATLSGKVQEEVGKAFPQVRTIVKAVDHGEAYAAGFRDGKEINLARPVEQADRAAIGGAV